MDEKVRETIYEIEINDYPNKITLSLKQRAKYYIKGKTKKKVPKKYLNKRFQYNEDGYLMDTATDERIIANPKVAGTPKMWNVNFQAIWNQQIKYQGRALITGKLKEALLPYVKQMIPIEEYPIGVEMFIVDTEMKVDVHNKSVIYHKVFHDLMVKPWLEKQGTHDVPIIPDDNVTHINDSGRLKFIKINNPNEAKMIVHVYKSDNKIW